jgi:hypothetical protein
VHRTFINLEARNGDILIFILLLGSRGSANY